MTKHLSVLITASLATLLALFAPVRTARADIFQWAYINPANPAQGKQPSTTLAPDGAGANAVPGANLLFRDLTKAYLIGANLTGAAATGVNFTNADLSYSNLSNADFTPMYEYWVANLTGANLSQANLTDADYSGYEGTGQKGEQYFYVGADLTGVNLSGANLTNTELFTANLTNANLSQTNLTNLGLSGVTLTGANLSGADVAGTSFSRRSVHNPYYRDFGGITPAQLYSTASYQAHDLTKIGLGGNDLAGANLAGQNLTNANFQYATLTGADLTGANIRTANFNRGYLAYSYGYFGGITLAQLYSTASYQAHDLTGIGLSGNDLMGVNLTGQHLTNASFAYAMLTNANMSGADARGANFQYATLTGANTSNLIQSDGHIAGLDLLSGATLNVRDYDGNPVAVPSTGPLPIVVDQHLAMDATGTLRLVFDADPWDSNISFANGIPVTRGGTLELTFSLGVDVATQSGRTIDLFDWTGVTPTGTFNISSPYTWNLSNLYTTGEVTLTAVTGILPGDFNNDSKVDAADYIMWRKNGGTAAAYDIWRTHFGQTAGSGAGTTTNAAIPEPSTLVMLVLAAAGVCSRRRRTA